MGTFKEYTQFYINAVLKNTSIFIFYVWRLLMHKNDSYLNKNIFNELRTALRIKDGACLCNIF